MSARRFIDIAVNLTDSQYRGIYHGKRYHSDDFDHVIDRAHKTGVDKILVTGTSYVDSKEAIELCENYSKPGYMDLYCTVGVHPCSAAEYDLDHHGDLNPITKLAAKGKQSKIVKAFGELGLDYDRLHFSPADIQRKYFKDQLDIAVGLDLPLFLHSRAAAEDFEAILSPYIKAGKLPKGGVVHSFTGTVEEAQRVLDLGLYIGVNGCSLRTQESLDVVKSIPLNKLVLETDGPWCEIRPSHASHKFVKQLPYKTVKKEKHAFDTMVKGRSEPCAVALVADVVAGVKELPVETVIEAAYTNSMNLFEF